MKQEMTYEEKAAFIFRARSAHDELLSALEMAERIVFACLSTGAKGLDLESVQQRYTQIKIALAKAKGEQ